jgi:Zn-dependent M28 family amino/carboxypeptidase
MITATYSYTKRLTATAFIALALLTGATLLTGCPPQKNISNKKATAITRLINIDSAMLIKRFAIISSGTMEGRETGTPGNERAREYIVHQFDSLQVAKTGDSYLQPFPAGNSGKQGYNIAGVIKGTHYPDTYIAVTAHYDHLGARNGTIYYGADDNASGTASLLAMIQYFKQHPPQHSLLFVVFDAEEKGLLGSKYFVAHSPVPLNTITMNINMDMVSRNDSNQIYACGTSYTPSLKRFVDSVQPHTSVNVLFGHDEGTGMQNWTNQSDHYPFHLNHIPFLYFGVEDHADYHRPGDTFEKVNKSFYYQVCTMITAVTTLADQSASIQ